MWFHITTIRTTLAIAIVVGMQLVASATTEWDYRIQQFGSQINWPQVAQFEVHTATTAVNHAGKTFFNYPPTLIRVAYSTRINHNLLPTNLR